MSLGEQGWADDKPHDVYWVYDRDDRVLYIGCSRQLEERLEQHKKKEWWHRVAWVEVETFGDRHSALEAEKAAIFAERPPFNKRVTAPRQLPLIIRRNNQLASTSQNGASND